MNDSFTGRPYLAFGSKGGEINVKQDSEAADMPWAEITDGVLRVNAHWWGDSMADPFLLVVATTEAAAVTAYRAVRRTFETFDSRSWTKAASEDDRYFVAESEDAPLREVDVRTFVNVEAAAGFTGRGHHADPPYPATASFGGKGGRRGMVLEAGRPFPSIADHEKMREEVRRAHED